MNVILATKIEGLGSEADLVTVKAGYGRNYLIPQGLALEATPANRRFINMLRKKRAEREAAELANFREIAQKIDAVKLELTLESGEKGRAFGAVTNRQIADALAAQGVQIDRRAIDLDKPLRKGGDYEIPAKLHPEVVATIRLHLVVTGEEPEQKPAPADQAQVKATAE